LSGKKQIAIWRFDDFNSDYVGLRRIDNGKFKVIRSRADWKKRVMMANYHVYNLTFT